MALVTTKDMFAKALKSDYAIGAFNVNNMEIIQGIVEAAQIEKSALILQVSAGARKYAKPAYLVKLVEAAIEDTGLDIALHLDHGEDFDICKKCVDDGFTSVMIDGSKHPIAMARESTPVLSTNSAASSGSVKVAERASTLMLSSTPASLPSSASTQTP